LALIILVILTAAGVLLWLDVLHWRLSKVTSAGIILFILSSPQIVQGLRLRQLGLLVALVIALAAWCVTRNHLATAGAMLAISTIKPQMAVLPMAWFLFWSLVNWRERWRLLVSFAITLAVLVGAGELILPGWLRDFLEGLNAYRSYMTTTSLIEVVLGRAPGRVFAAALLAALSVLAWRNRKEYGTSSEFILTLSAFMVCATVALPLLPPCNQVLLLLPVLIILRNWMALPAFARLAFALTLAWPAVISLALLFLVHPNPQTSSRLPLLPSYGTLLVPFLLLVSLVAGKLRPSTVNSAS
jgi:Glycosyltransferase family 87